MYKTKTADYKFIKLNNVNLIIILKYITITAVIEKYETNEPVEVNVHWQLIKSLLHSAASMT